MADQPLAEPTATSLLDAAKALDPLIVLDDEPTWGFSFDTLGLTDQAQVIAGAALGTRGPFTIGVHGEWGHGKTSVLRQAKSLLDATTSGKADGRPYRPNVVTVWFNAWQYQHEEQPIVPLVATIVQAVDGHLARTSRIKSELKKAFMAWSRALRSIVYGFSARARVEVPGLGHLQAGFAAKEMIDRHEKLSQQDDPLIEQSVYYRAFEVLNSVVGRDRALTPEQLADAPKVVVFIDDLDRCTPDQAIRLLEHTKLVLAQPGFVFVLGVARKVLEGFLQHRYEHDFHYEQEAVKNAGQDYLEKIIQLPIDLPDHDQRFAAHTRRVLEGAAVKTSLGFDQIDEKVQATLVDLLATTTSLNPRKLVRRLNNLIVDRRVAMFPREVEGEPAPAVVGDEEGQVTLPTFVEFAVISQTLKEGLGGKELFDVLWKDDGLCDALAIRLDAAFDPVDGDEVKADPRTDTRETLLRRRLATAIRMLLPKLRELLAEEESGQRWLTDHPTRRLVTGFLATQRDEQEDEEVIARETVDGDQFVEDAIRHSLNLEDDANITDAERNLVRDLDLSHFAIDDDGLRSVRELANLSSLDLAVTKVTDAGLVHLRNLKSLSSLNMLGARVTDEGLAHLAQLSNLSSLNLSATRVADEGLAHLKGLANLSSLDLSTTNVTGRGLVHLQDLPNLSSLDLMTTNLADEGLAHLRRLSNLSSLNLSATKVTDKGLTHLKGLSSLSMLDLGHTKVTNEGLTHLKGFSDLARLDLRRTKVSDKGLIHLSGLTSLLSLNLYRTRVTDEGVAALEKALPELDVRR